MIRDDQVDPQLACTRRRLARADAAVHRDDQPRPVVLQTIHRGWLQAVTVAQALWNEMHDVGAEQLERAAKDDGGGDAVYVIVAVNGDALLRGDCGEDAIDRRRHIRESERVVQVLELWRQETTRIVQADQDPGNWLTTGRTYSEQRYSPLTKIDAGNVKQLGLAWFVDLDTHRGQEATPLVIDGVLYSTSAWSKVQAIDAASGKLLWQYDPKVPGETGVKACCDTVNRGVAAYQGKLFVGTLDGRLVALDAATGNEVWSVVTVDQTKAYTITGAPRVIKGKVIIGNGGAEFGVRGYISAYDAATGKMLWRFYTVPGDPSKPFEAPILAEAAKTWHGEWWKLGGGGTVWDSMAYDPDLDLLYIGTGNGSPWNQQYRSPGGGDNLFLSAIVALKPDTGEYVWHYQSTPGETWDFTATQHIVLADLTI